MTNSVTSKGKWGSLILYSAQLHSCSTKLQHNLFSTTVLTKFKVGDDVAKIIIRSNQGEKSQSDTILSHHVKQRKASDLATFEKLKSIWTFHLLVK